MSQDMENNEDCFWFLQVNPNVFLHILTHMGLFMIIHSSIGREYLTIIRYLKLVISDSIHIFYYDIPVKALAIQPMFPTGSCYKANRSLLNLFK